MYKPRTMNRWKVVFGALLIQFSLGAIYAWSVFTPALKAAGWTKLDTQTVFSLGLVCFALVMVWAGRALDRWGPQKLAIASGLTLSLAYILAGALGATHFWVVSACIGLLGGAGIGIGYVVPIAVGMRWFPDRKGMITGLAVAGFGFGAMGWVKLAGAWGHLIETMGLAGTFIVYGAAFAVLILGGSTWMRMPPEDWVPEGYTPPVNDANSGGEDFTVREMLRTPQFYLIMVTFAVSAAAGLMSIGLMKLYPMEALQASGYGALRASAIAGTAMAVFFSLANGIGRIAWGVLSDRLGRRRSIILMTASQACVLVAFTSMAGNEYLLYLGATLIGFNFGGNFALFPTITADVFGNRRVGANYPIVFLAYGIGGIAGPMLGGLLGDMGNFPMAFAICAVACGIGALCITMVVTPDHEEASQSISVHGFLHQMHMDRFADVIEHAIHPDHFQRVAAPVRNRRAA